MEQTLDVHADRNADTAPGQGVGSPAADRSGPRLVLASGSPYRARLLAEHGIEATIDPPDVDERALDHLFVELGAEGFALDLARRKAAVVGDRHSGARVIAADQVGVVTVRGRRVQLTKQHDADTAVAQLMAMSGGTHELVNGLVCVDLATGQRAEGVDRQLVTMRNFDEAEARSYVERFEPFDSSGSYRLEDQARMAPLAPFVTAVVGEHDTGVLGLPIPLLRRLLGSLPDRASPGPSGWS